MKDNLIMAMYSDYINKLNGENTGYSNIIKILYLAKAYALSAGLDDAFKDIVFTNNRKRSMGYKPNYNLDVNGFRCEIVEKYYMNVTSFINNNKYDAFDMSISNDEKECIKFIMSEIPNQIMVWLIYGGVVNNNTYLPILSETINDEDMKKYYCEEYFEFIVSNMDEIKGALS